MNVNIPDDRPLNRNEKVQILLREYDTLRTEVLQRLNSWYQMCAAAVTAAAAIAVALTTHFTATGLSLLALLPLPIWAMFRSVDFDMHQLGGRLRELETLVNELAGEKLLAWETERGGILPSSQRGRIEHMLGPFRWVVAWLRQGTSAY